MLKRIFLAAFVALAPSLAFGQVLHWGDFEDGDDEPLVIDFNTKDPATGVPAAVTGLTLAVRELGATTEDTDCITFNDDADSLVGYHEASINFQDTYFVPGKRYSVIITAGTCGGVNIFPSKVASFSTNQYASATDVSDAVMATATTEPTSPPSATATLGEKINWLFLIARNRKKVTNALIEWYADDATTVVGEADLNPSTDTTVDQHEAAAP